MGLIFLKITAWIAISLLNVLNQQYFTLETQSNKFDSRYCGINAWNKLKKMIKETCIGCTLILAHCSMKSDGKYWFIYCYCYIVQNDQSVSYHVLCCYKLGVKEVMMNKQWSKNERDARKSNSNKKNDHQFFIEPECQLDDKVIKMRKETACLTTMAKSEPNKTRCHVKLIMFTNSSDEKNPFLVIEEPVASPISFINVSGVKSIRSSALRSNQHDL